MQNACEEVVLSLGPADVDNGGILEEANETLARVVQRVKGFVNHDRSLVKS
jgi:hypothetical protein